MTDYMLTVISATGTARDVRVNHAPNILDAIRLAESATGMRVDHGRGGVGDKFVPGVIIDAGTGDIDVVHDAYADVSMTRASIPGGWREQ